MALSADRFRAVLDVLMTVVVMPIGRTGPRLDQRRVQITWR